ncbi:MAG: redox-sensing transcriptional repressor Rex [Clostridia bacterium]|nr:redox-sensing transcriptional repressor Rex [Clostridia bacterium]
MKDNNAQAEKKRISPYVIKRLPRYRRYLGELMKEGVERISSAKLSELMGYTASQIRQDLNNFGAFGQQGYGYKVDFLYEQIGNIMGLDKEYSIIVVGFGRLGQAMAGYIDQYEKQFRIVGIFDVPDKVSSIEFGKVYVSDMDSLKEFCRRNKVDMAVLTVPRSEAQHACDAVVDAGVKGIWNFTSVDLTIPEDVHCENVHMSDSLHELSYHLKDK